MQQSASRKGIVRLDRDEGAGLLRLNLSDDYAPSRTFAVDHVVMAQGIDGVNIVLGRLSPFETTPVFHYAVSVTFPFAQFYNQLFKSLQTPAEPGKPLFVDSVKASMEQYGYSVIREMPKATFRDGLEPKLGSGRYNVGLLYLFGDEASIDFLHLDAMSLALASQGKKIPQSCGSDAIRFVMAPNVLLVFLELVGKAGAAIKEKTPNIDHDLRQA